MTKNAGMEQFYEKMGGMSIPLFPNNTFPLNICSSPLHSSWRKDRMLMIAMAPDEAAPILADFAGKLNMEMSGKFWAPSTSLLIIYLLAPCSLLHPIQLCSIAPSNVAQPD
jgi:hypothetical protein